MMNNYCDCNEMSRLSCEISVFYSLWKILKHFLLFQMSFMRQWLHIFVPYIENSLISNSLISKGHNIMSPIGTAGAPKICPLYRISLRSRVTISRVDCIFNLFYIYMKFLPFRCEKNLLSTLSRPGQAHDFRGYREDKIVDFPKFS